MIERTRVLVETPLKTRSVTMVTVSEVKGEYHYNNNSLGGYCTKHPIALALLTSKGVKAFAIDGNEMEMDDFIKNFPETRPLLGKRPRRRKNNTGDSPLKP
jgi:hypothetical protein